QFLHHPMDHDGRRSLERLAHLDHPYLRARVRPSALGRRLGLFGAPVHHLDDLGLLLCACPDRRQEEGPGGMSTIAETATTSAPTRRRKRVDGWRWTGRIFLALMLFYTAVP